MLLSFANTIPNHSLPITFNYLLLSFADTIPSLKPSMIAFDSFIFQHYSQLCPIKRFSYFVFFVKHYPLPFIIHFLFSGAIICQAIFPTLHHHILFLQHQYFTLLMLIIAKHYSKPCIINTFSHLVLSCTKHAAQQICLILFGFLIIFWHLHFRL